MKNVKIYTWTFCPYCLEAKSILKKKGIEFEEIVIDGDKEAFNKLKKETNSGSVPQIFVDETFIGGCDDLKTLNKKGDLEEIFK